MTRRRNKKRRTKRGGQKVHIDILNSSTQVCVHENDCGPEVFHAMGYMSLENAKYLAALRPKGLKQYEVIAMLRQAYGPVTVRDISHIDLKNNEAVVAEYFYIDGVTVNSHYFIIYKKPEGDELYVFDPQMDKIGLEAHDLQVDENREGTLLYKDYIRPHMELPNIEGFNVNYIHSEEVTHHKERVTREIIDSVFNAYTETKIQLPDWWDFSNSDEEDEPSKRHKR
jgi:hypothetical protein